MTDWAAIVAGDFAVPAGDLGLVVTELTEALASPDPAVRDEQAYPVLVTWILRGELDGRLGELGDRVAGMLRHPEIQARTFAVLILAGAVNRDNAAGVLDDATVRRWRDAFVDWYLSERDLRGWDPRLGWLHAIAHGADALDEFGASPRLATAELVRLLEVAATRLVTPTGYLFAHQEDDRLAYAMARLLCRPELSAADAVGWLGTVRRCFDEGEPGPVPPQASNTIRTLRCLYVMVDRGVRAADTVLRPAHGAEIRAAVGDALAMVFPGQA